MNCIQYEISLALLGLMLCSFKCTADDNTSKTYFVPRVKTTDKMFNHLNKKVLEQEEECIYYTDTINYGIWLFNRSDTIFFTYEVNDQIASFVEHDNLLGAFAYKKHLFFIYGDTLPSNLFCRTKKSVIIHVSKPWESLEDDSWSIYTFYLHDSVYYSYGSRRRGVKKTPM